MRENQVTVPHMRRPHLKINVLLHIQYQKQMHNTDGEKITFSNFHFLLCAEGGPVLQMLPLTAPPPPTPTDPPPPRAPRSTSWASTLSPAAPTPSTAQWPPTRRQAPPSRDAWAKPAPHWPDTRLQPVATETASPPAL